MHSFSFATQLKFLVTNEFFPTGFRICVKFKKEIWYWPLVQEGRIKSELG